MDSTSDYTTDAGRFQKLVDYARDAMQNLRAPGVALGLWFNGREYTGELGVTSLENPLPVTSRTLFKVASITKTLTAMAIFQLIEQGQIRLEDHVRRFLPEFRVRDGNASARATVFHLLNHTAGWMGDYCKNTGDGDDALKKYVESMADLPQLLPIGTQYAYNNASFNVAGRIVEIVYGKPYEIAIQEMVLNPLEMTNSFFFPDQVMDHRFATGHILNGDNSLVARPWAINRGEAPCGGLVSDVHDLIKFARFHLGDGMTLKGEHLLTQESMTCMQTPTVNTGNDCWMGLNWFIHDIGGLRFLRHSGETHGQCAILWFAPERGFAFTALTNLARGMLLHEALFKWVCEHFLNIDSS